MQKLEWTGVRGFTRILDLPNNHVPSIGFALIKASEDDTYRYESCNREACLVVLSGNWTVATSAHESEHLLHRRSVFCEKPSAVYCPANSVVDLRATSEGEMAVCESWGQEQAAGSCTVVSSDQIRVVNHGAQNFKRRAYEILDDRIDANMLVVGETISEPGNWSSFPPHKHDTDNPPHESQLEELYYFRFDPAQGFGFQRIYSDDRSLDETHLVEEGSVIPIPHGYHPVVSAPGYSHYYLWILAGKKRILKPYFDPRFAWLKP